MQGHFGNFTSFFEVILVFFEVYFSIIYQNKSEFGLPQVVRSNMAVSQGAMTNPIKTFKKCKFGIALWSWVLPFWFHIIKYFSRSFKVICPKSSKFEVLKVTLSNSRFSRFSRSGSNPVLY